MDRVGACERWAVPAAIVSRRSGTFNIPMGSDRRRRASATARPNRPRWEGARRRVFLGGKQLSNPGTAEHSEVIKQ